MNLNSYSDAEGSEALAERSHHLLYERLHRGDVDALERGYIINVKLGRTGY